MGVVGYFSTGVGGADGGEHVVDAGVRLLHWILHHALLLASQSAHVGALYPAFLSMMLASGAPPMLAAISLAFNTNLFGVDPLRDGQSAVFSSKAIFRSCGNRSVHGGDQRSYSGWWGWRGGRSSVCGRIRAGFGDRDSAYTPGVVDYLLSSTSRRASRAANPRRSRPFSFRFGVSEGPVTPFAARVHLALVGFEAFLDVAHVAPALNPRGFKSPRSGSP